MTDIEQHKDYNRYVSEDGSNAGTGGRVILTTAHTLAASNEEIVKEIFLTLEATVNDTAIIEIGYTAPGVAIAYSYLGSFTVGANSSETEHIAFVVPVPLEPGSTFALYENTGLATTQVTARWHGIRLK